MSTHNPDNLHGLHRHQSHGLLVQACGSANYSQIPSSHPKPRFCSPSRLTKSQHPGITLKVCQLHMLRSGLHFLKTCETCSFCGSRLIEWKEVGDSANTTTMGTYSSTACVTRSNQQHPGLLRILQKDTYSYYYIKLSKVLQ